MKATATFERGRHDGIIGAVKISTLGEFGLIGLIADAVKPTHPASSVASRRTIIGIGDDTAAWQGSDLVQLATIDSLIEDVHFRFDWCSWEDLGYKSLAVNLSDIAAMGGQALYALVALSCPGDVDSDNVLDYYRGMTRLALEHGVVIIGGNLTTSQMVTSTVSLVGEIRPDLLMTRSAALPGDAIAVTGVLGGAAAALALLDAGCLMTTHAHLLNSLLRPRARLTEAHVLAELGVRCAIDISDGLLGDLEHICSRSGVSATIHSAQVPHFVDDAIPTGDQTMFALTGGENYELMFTCAPAMLKRVAAALSCPVTVVGEIMAAGASPSVIIVLDARGEPVKIDRPGWRHFAA